MFEYDYLFLVVFLLIVVQSAGRGASVAPTAAEGCLPSRSTIDRWYSPTNFCTLFKVWRTSLGRLHACHMIRTWSSVKPYLCSIAGTELAGYGSNRSACGIQLWRIRSELVDLSVQQLHLPQCIICSMQVWYPLLRFREEGMTTFTVGPEEGKIYASKKGYPAKADKSIDNVTTQVIVIICIYNHTFQLPIYN